MIYKVLALIFLNLFSFISLKAQSDQNLENLKNIVPPSPNSASLGKYGELPIGLYTGIPNINIPIYELKTQGITVPISLSYHAGGLRVTEIAPQVGLGWSLNAGGDRKSTRLNSSHSTLSRMPSSA